MMFYNELIEEMRMKIVQKYGSVAKFCEQNKVSRQNLFKVFSGKQDISVGFYLRICVSLGVVAPLPTIPDCCVSLRDYLSVDHDLLIKSILQVLLKG